MLFAFAKKSLANSLDGVLLKYTVPRSELVPDLVLRFVTPPSVLPKAASNVAVWTLNSWSVSAGGTYDAITCPASAVAVLGTPSIVRSLRLPRVPSIA